MSREPSNFSVAFLLSTKVSSGMALGFRIRYLGDQGEAGMDKTEHRPLTMNGTPGAVARELYLPDLSEVGFLRDIR